MKTGTGTEALRVFGAEDEGYNQNNNLEPKDKNRIVTNPKNIDISQNIGEKGISISDPRGKEEWAKYKAYFLQKLKAELKLKLKLDREANILFVDDDNTNTTEANSVGFDTLTKNQQGLTDAKDNHSIQWTIHGLTHVKRPDFDKAITGIGTEFKFVPSIKAIPFPEERIAALAKEAVADITPAE